MKTKIVRIPSKFKTQFLDFEIVQRISTHTAVLAEDKIYIITTGLIMEDLTFEPEIINVISAENIDDILPMFERFEENNRINRLGYV